MSELRGRALALAALAHIEAHPNEWQQSGWRCDTCCCIAGHVAMIGGCEWVHGTPTYARDAMGDPVKWPDGTVEPVAVAAVKLLGIPGYMGSENHLFNPWNSLDELRDLIDEYLPSSPHTKDV